MLAQQRRTRVRDIVRFDPNVDGTVVVETTIAAEGRKLSVGASASQLWLGCKVDSALFFSVGRRNEIFHTMTPDAFIAARGLAVFTEQAESASSSARRWLSVPGRTELLSRLELRAGEALHVFKNGIHSVVNSDRTLSEEMFSLFVAIAHAVESPAPSSDESPIDLPSAPAQLTQLIHRFGHFAESDDDIRDQAAAALDRAARAQLLAQVAPLLPAIDSYLDSLAAPWPDSALKLSWLARLVAELAVSDSP